MAETADLLTAARAEALFVSELSAYTPCTEAVVTAAIRRAVRTHGGTRGCAGEVAAAYGDHPETALPRMRWAISLVENIYARSPRCVTHHRGTWADPHRSEGLAAFLTAT